MPLQSLSLCKKDKCISSKNFESILVRYSIPKVQKESAQDQREIIGVECDVF